MLRATAFSVCFAAGLTAAEAETNIMFILDGSNSMWGRIDGEAKIETAKSVLNEALSGLSAGVVPALMIYGHRQKDECSDVQLVVPLGSGTVADLMGAISAVSPRGKTPIADSLKAAGEAFAGREEENNNILLISDGIETCEGDPCAVAGALVQRGINVRVHVVGFDVDAEARAQLQCIAERGNGKYFDARNASGFQEAVQQAQEIAVAQAPEPEPADARPTIYFEDQFDGRDLSDDWEIVNPNPDAYLVENGVLTILAQDGTKATYRDAGNILRLSKPIPQGDWTMTARFLFAPHTMGENIRIGIAKEEENSLLTSLQLSQNIHQHYGTKFEVRSDKLTRGAATGFAREVHSIADPDLELRSAQFTDKVKGVLLRLEKSGRQYVSAVRFESRDPGAEDAVSEDWLTVQELTSLRSPGDAFTIMFGSDSGDDTPGGGEGLVEVDWVRVDVNE